MCVQSPDRVGENKTTTLATAPRSQSIEVPLANYYNMWLRLNYMPTHWCWRVKLLELKCSPSGWWGCGKQQQLMIAPQTPQTLSSFTSTLHKLAVSSSNFANRRICGSHPCARSTVPSSWSLPPSSSSSTPSVSDYGVLQSEPWGARFYPWVPTKAGNSEVFFFFAFT